MSVRGHRHRPGLLVKYTRMVLVAARQRGLRAGLGDLLAQWTFDRRHGLGALLPREVRAPAADPGFRLADAVQYQGVDPRLALEVLGCIPEVARARSTFIDFGCGKGRGLAVGMLAGFRRLIGVEISGDLAAACDRNLRTLRSRHPGIEVEIRIEDAARFALPEGPLVAFLYNPFLGPTLERVAEALGRQAVRWPVWVGYVNPRGRAAFPAERFIERMCWGPSRAVLLESRPVDAAPGSTPPGCLPLQLGHGGAQSIIRGSEPMAEPLGPVRSRPVDERRVEVGHPEAQAGPFCIGGGQQGLGVGSSQPMEHGLPEAGRLREVLDASVEDDAGASGHPVAQECQVQGVEAQGGAHDLAADGPGSLVEAVDGHLGMMQMPALHLRTLLGAAEPDHQAGPEGAGRGPQVVREQGGSGEPTDGGVVGHRFQRQRQTEAATGAPIRPPCDPPHLRPRLG